MDEIVPHHGSYELHDLSKDYGKEENRTDTVQEPETTGHKGEDNADFCSKKDER